MSGLREVIETFQVPLDPTKDFRLALPHRILQDEPHRERVVEIWNKDVVPTINNLCRARKSGFINRSLKRSIFQTGMENVCKDFSRKTDNISVQCQASQETDQYHHSRKILTYCLIFTRLSAVTQRVRNARFCVAEIPTNPHSVPAVQAEFVTTSTTTTANEQQQQLSSLGTLSMVDHAAELSMIPCAHSEIISTHVPIVVDSEQAYVNPPVASQVIALVEQEDEEYESMRMQFHNINDRDSRRTPLERMQELESIKTFLTQTEYSAKRQAILDSI